MKMSDYDFPLPCLLNFEEEKQKKREKKKKKTKASLIGNATSYE